MLSYRSVIACNDIFNLSSEIDSMEFLLNEISVAFVLTPVLGAFITARFTKYGIKLANGIIVQAGLVGTLIGLVQILGNVSDPIALSPAFSYSLLTILYALILSAVFTLLCVNLTPELPDFRISYSIAAVLGWIVMNVWAMSLGASINAYIHVSSIVLLAFSILIIAATSRFDVEDSILLCAKYLPYAGLIGFLIGAIIILQNLSDPRSIGPALAMSLLIMLYTNMVSIAIKLGFPKINQNNESSHWQYLGFSVLLLTLIFWLLFVSIS